MPAQTPRRGNEIHLRAQDRPWGEGTAHTPHPPASLDLGCEHDRPTRLLPLCCLVLLRAGPLCVHALTHTGGGDKDCSGGIKVVAWPGQNHPVSPSVNSGPCHEKGHRCLGCVLNQWWLKQDIPSLLPFVRPWPRDTADSNQTFHPCQCLSPSELGRGCFSMWLPGYQDSKFCRAPLSGSEVTAWPCTLSISSDKRSDFTS